MPARIASTVAIGLLAGVSCLFTAFAVPVPIWVVFVAWACFFAAGGGLAAARSTLVTGAAGVLSATLTLLAATTLGGSAWAIAGCVVLGAGALVALGHFPPLAFTPAGFLGFASTVGTIAATDSAITDPVGLGHPAVLVVAAFVIGVGFGLCSEWASSRLTLKSAAKA